MSIIEYNEKKHLARERAEAVEELLCDLVEDGTISAEEAEKYMILFSANESPSTRVIPGIKNMCFFSEDELKKKEQFAYTYRMKRIDIMSAIDMARNLLLENQSNYTYQKRIYDRLLAQGYSDAEAASVVDHIFTEGNHETDHTACADPSDASALESTEAYLLSKQDAYVLLGYLSAIEEAEIAESRIKKRLALIRASGDLKRLNDFKDYAVRSGTSRERIAQMFDPFIKNENNNMWLQKRK